jgi:hypothetical protein
MTYAEYARWLWDHRGDSRSNEWRVVLCFYAAVHATNAMLYGGGVAPQSHQTHQLNLSKRGGFVLLPEYEQLRELSEQARYVPALRTPCMKPALSRHRRQPQADRHDGDGVEVG